MFRRTTVSGMGILLLIGLMLTSPSLSQQEQRAQRGQRGDRQGQPRERGQGQGRQGQRGQRPEERQSEAQRMQERLGATDQEWKVLGPRVMRVSELSRQLRGGGRDRGRGGSQGGRPDSRQDGSTRERSALEQAQEQLRTVLSNTSATPDQINKQLAAFRTVKARVKQQLVAAQTDLRKLITVRQEAQLVMMGMLD